MDQNSDQNDDTNDETNKTTADNKQIVDNLIDKQNDELIDSKDVNQCPTASVKTSVGVIDCEQTLVATTVDTKTDRNVDTNCDNREDCEQTVENVANDSTKDNQMNAENNDLNLSSNDSNDSSDKFMSVDDEEEEEEEDNLYSFDPTPSTPYPSIKWHSLQQLQQREYGKLFKPGNKRPVNTYESQTFRRYAYNSLYFFQRLELMSKFEEHNGCVNCLNFNNSGDRLISGSDDLRICVWDWQKATCALKYHSGHTSNVFQCKWCADQQHIVSCARDGQVRIGNVQRNGTSVSNKLAQHKGAAHKLTLSAPQVILSCAEDAVVFEIDLREDKPNKLLIAKNGSDQKVPLYSIHTNMVFNPYHFVVSGRDPFVRIYDRRFLSTTGGSVVPVLNLCPEKLRDSKHSVTSAQYNPTAEKVLSTYNDEDIYTFDAKTGLLDNCYNGHRNSATVKGCVWFGEDFIVSGSDDGYIYGWDAQSQHIVMSLYADENGVVNCIEPHPTAPIMATSGLDDDVKVWVPSANEWPQTLKGIKQRICSNVRDRQRSQRRFQRISEEGFDGEDGTIDPSMLYMIIRHMRRHSRRRRNANNNPNVDEESENTDTDSDADNAGPHECMQS